LNNKIKQLKTLLKLDEQKVSISLLKYSKAKNSYNELKVQHKMLIDYKDEYHMALQGKTNKILNAQMIQIYDRFIVKLGLAIKDQEGKIISAKKLSSDLFNDYLKLKQKAEGLERILESEIDIEQLRQQKQEQKQNDESAGNQWYINRNNES